MLCGGEQNRFFAVDCEVIEIKYVTQIQSCEPVRNTDKMIWIMINRDGQLRTKIANDTFRADQGIGFRSFDVHLYEIHSLDIASRNEMVYAFGFNLYAIPCVFRGPTPGAKIPERQSVFWSAPQRFLNYLDPGSQIGIQRQILLHDREILRHAFKGEYLLRLLREVQGRIAPATTSIDHHVSGRPFADVNWIDPSAVATAEMVYKLAREAGVTITPEIANRYLGHGSGLGRARWVVERTFAWLHHLKRLLVRYDRRHEIHEAFLAIGCCLVCFKRLQHSL